MKYWVMFALASARVFALPQNPAVVAGDVTTISSSNTLELIAGDRAIVHWDQFSIGQSESVHFVQPSVNASVLNRVVGNQGSEIFGQLHGNGRVFLINPHGVVIGPNALIEAGSFLASTIDVALDEMLWANGATLFEGGSSSAIVNHGTIRALGGDVVLIGQTIENLGSITAHEGHVALGAAGAVWLKLENEPLLTIKPKIDPNAHLSVGGTIEALTVSLQSEGRPYTHGINMDGVVSAVHPVTRQGKIYLTADSVATGKESQLHAGELVSISVDQGMAYLEGAISADAISIENTGQDALVFHLGSMEANAVEINTPKYINTGSINAADSSGGKIAIHTKGPYIETVQGHLSAHGGTITIVSDSSLFSSGVLDVSGNEGGAIELKADRLTLVSAALDASGEVAGGTIQLIAREAHVTGDAAVKASAKRSGNGGFIYVMSEEKTIAWGSMEANGGAIGGNGGSIEVSSLGDLVCSAKLSATATKGKAGVVCLDPKNIVIDATNGIYPQYQFIDPTSGSGTGGPTGFGGVFAGVRALSTGNVTISKSSDNVGGSSAGAAYLYNGLTAALISTLIGSTASDQVGSSGVTPLSNGNYVIISPNWDNGATAGVGAVTFASGSTGVSGVVSASNSLIGSTANDQIGSTAVDALTNGNYVVRSQNWDNGGVSNIGAVTWCDGTTGRTGTVTTSNSLTGSTTSDQVGSAGLTALSNGNYVVISTLWNNGATADTGAVTWCDGTTGRTGAVSSSNSLVGSTASDQIGSGGIVALTNGHYVVRSPLWNNGATADVGAATWCNGTTGLTGAVSSSNSLIGSTASDQVSSTALTALSNGNYVVASANWDDGGTADVGAVTWCNGSVGRTGTVTTANSLHGSTVTDQVGSSVTALTNGHYVVGSSLWNNGGTADVGAATWCDGTTGRTGAVSTSNSLVGSTASDQVSSSGITALSNGNYVVSSRRWDNAGTVDVGAVTWCDGTTGRTGTVSAANSLIGSTTNDFVGISGTVALTNGNYVVTSPSWNNGAITSAGAVTWGNGTVGTTGVVSTANSLVGSSASDNVGNQSSFNGIVALTNGHYVVASSSWSNGSITDVGAITWCNGTTGGTVGPVSTSNSIYGSTASDTVGGSGSTTANLALTNGDYLICSPSWNNGSLSDAGAVTLGNGTGGSVGALSAQNSIVGQTASATLGNIMREDTVNQSVIVRFTAEGTGVVRAGLYDANQMTFARAQAQTMTVTPSLITETLDAGTDVLIQANNDITVSSAIVSTAAANLTMRAGRSIVFNAGITTNGGSVTAIANDLLSSGVVDAQRDSGSAVITCARDLVFSTGAGNITLSLLNGQGKTNTASGDLFLDHGVTLQTTSGAINLLAQEHNVLISTGTNLQTTDGMITITAGESIQTTTFPSLSAIGSGQLILVTDNLYSTAPQFGTGAAILANTSLSTNGGKLLIYTSERSRNKMPQTINNVAYTPGPEFVNSTTEKWGIYYPSSSGVPFTIFYKNTGTSPAETTALHGAATGSAEPFQRWENPWYDDIYLSSDIYAPYLTPKSLHLKLPTLVDNDEGQEPMEPPLKFEY